MNEKELEKIFLESKVWKDGRRYYNRQKLLYSHIVWNFYNPKDQIKKDDGYVIHHKDGDPSNEKIENLQKLINREHSKLHNVGRKHTIKTKEKISSAHIGKHLSEDHKKKISYSQTGKYISKETKEKMSFINTGKILSKETKEKMSLSRIGKHHSKETKEKMSLSQKGRHHSEETKLKISLSKRKIK